MYVCEICNRQYSKWSGKCSCGAWSSIVEKSSELSEPSNNKNARQIALSNDEHAERVITGIGEFDRVSILQTKATFLIGGEPGIGKSTLMCQICSGIETLYLCGEEAVYSVKNRMQRLESDITNVSIVPFFMFEDLEALLIEYKPKIVILDSIFTTRSKQSNSPQEIVEGFSHLARKYNFCAILVSHITKDGLIAGPKALEHMVDAVLCFEGDRYGAFRILRAVKNRFGSTSEIGVFEMREKGLVEIKNPSFVKKDNNLSGSVIFCGTQGNRPFLVEVQALVHSSSYPQVETYGIEPKRVRIILGILQKRCNVNLKMHDVFVKSVGDIKISDSSVDLAVAVAIISSLKNIVVGSNCVFWGEIGLTGEIRPSPYSEVRKRECDRLGFQKTYDDSYSSLFLLLKQIDLI